MEEKDPMLRQVRAKVDDKNHEILYKSPGSNRGTNGRTFDWIQAKTKEEAAQLIANGWSVSEEEAHELADALKAGKKGKKRLVRQDEEDEDEEAEEDEEEADAAEEESSEQGDDLGLGSPKKPKKAPAKAPAKKRKR